MSGEQNSAVDGDGEWGWDVQIEAEADENSNPPEATIETRSRSNTMKSEDSPAAAGAPKRTNSFKTYDPKHAVAVGNASLAGALKSSPSFQELENAIGATLAMSLNDADQTQTYVDLQRQQNLKYGIMSQKNNPRQYRQPANAQIRPNNRLRPRTASEMEYSAINARTELGSFVNEPESRAIIIFHSPQLSPSAVRNSCQMFGLLYYLRPEFHVKGVTFIGYYDLRSAINAFNSLADELGIHDPSVSVHYSVMLHSSNNCDEYRLVVRNLSPAATESDVQVVLSRYGTLRYVHKRYEENPNGDRSRTEFLAEYYSIQDARIAMSELCSATSTQSWGPDVSLVFASLEADKQAACQQLLSVLAGWRTEMTHFGDVQQQALPMRPQYPMAGYGMDVSMLVGGYTHPVQYGHTSRHGTGTMLQYVQPNIIMGRSGVPIVTSPQILSHSPTYGAPVVFATPAQQQYLTHSLSHSLRPVHDTVDWDGHNVWDGHYTHGGRGSDQGTYTERPPHHNGGHNITTQVRRQRQSGAVDSDFVLNIERVTAGTDIRTTLMIRNIPNKYTQAMLLKEINVHHEGTYDFYYLPIDFKNRCNVGYAFINFMDPLSIVAFYRDFNAKRWLNFNSEKVCALSYARIQGKAAMVGRFQNSSLLEKDSEYRPLLFHSSGPDKGKPEHFPLASQRPNDWSEEEHHGAGGDHYGEDDKAGGRGDR